MFRSENKAEKGSQRESDRRGTSGSALKQLYDHVQSTRTRNFDEKRSRLGPCFKISIEFDFLAFT